MYQGIPPSPEQQIQPMVELIIAVLSLTWPVIIGIIISSIIGFGAIYSQRKQQKKEKEELPTKTGE
jgi:hypothetical protein